MPAVPAQSRSRAVLGPDARAERGLSAVSAAAGRDTPHRAPAGPWAARGRTRGRCGPRGGCLCCGNRSPWLCRAAAPGCHLHCARGPSGDRILPWRDLVWGRPPWRAAGHLPPGLPGTGAAPEPLGGPTVESGPAATGEAGSDLEAIAGSRRCRETTCPCLLRREAQRAQGRCRRSPAPHPCPGTTPLRRPPGWQSTRAVRDPPRRRGCVGRGSGAGGYSQIPLLWSPPGLCLALGPSRHGAGQVAAVGGCASARAGLSCSPGGVRADSVQAASRGRLQ